jgi:hypothetical protein
LSLEKISQSTRQIAIQAGLDTGMKQRYLISEKQQLFIKKIAAGYNGNEAARQAGYH